MQIVGQTTTSANGERIEQLAIDAIRGRNDDEAIVTDADVTQLRQLDEHTVKEYAADMDAADGPAKGAKFPPIDVFFDGTDYWLADGFHRLAAARTAGKTDISAVIYHGTARDAILHAVGCNDKHGLRRSNSDKRFAVEMLLEDGEWTRFSDRHIAVLCRVSNTFVSKLRKENDERRRKLSTVNVDSCPARRVGRDGKCRPASQPKPAVTTQVQTDEREPGDDTDVIEAERKANCEARRANGRQVYDPRLKPKAMKALRVLIRAMDELTLFEVCREHFNAIEIIIESA